jgi:predicted PurR-regulated permease PerM
LWARATLVVFVLALLLAYLLEPIVAAVERLLPWMPRVRGTSIAVVYVIGALLVVAVGYALAPSIADHVRRVEATLPELAACINRMTTADHSDFVAGAVTRATGAAAAAAEDIGWLLVVPILAIFFLENRTPFSTTPLTWSRGAAIGTPPDAQFSRSTRRSRLTRAPS